MRCKLQLNSSRHNPNPTNQQLGLLKNTRFIFIRLVRFFYIFFYSKPSLINFRVILKSSNMASRPQELLLISSRSSEPFSTLIVNPLTGGSYWSYKGSELQNGVTGLVEPLGRSGDYILISIDDKPLLHIVAVHGKNKFHVKSVLSGLIKCLVSHPQETYVFAAIGAQIFAWSTYSGELLSIIDAHYQSISCMKISPDGSFIVTGSEDGTVHVYSIVDLVSEPEHQALKIEPLFKWNAHSLAVTDLHITFGHNPRIISVSMDHTAAFYSLTQKTPFHRISADRPLVACAMDSAETRLFLGTDQGQIAMINLYTQCQPREQMITTNGGKPSQKLKILENHTASISKIVVNADGSLLASTDIEGNYAMVDVRSLQCLKLNSMRGKVHTVRFIENWPSLYTDYTPTKMVPSVLQKQKGSVKLDPFVIINGKENKSIDFLIQSLENDIELLISRFKNGSTSAPSIPIIPETKKKLKKRKRKMTTENDEPMADTSMASEDIESLKREIVKLKQTNQQLFDYAANLIMKS